MRPTNRVDVVDLLEVAHPERGGDDRRGGAGDAVGGEHQVVRRRGPGEAVQQVGPHGVPELLASNVGTPVGVDVVAATGGPVHQLVGQLVVVLQGMDQRRRVDAQLDRRAQRKPQELRVPGGQGVLVGGPVDEVIGQIRTGLTDLTDVVDRQVQLLEGEPADLAHHAGNQMVGRLRERMPLRPGRAALRGALLHTEEAVGVQSQRPRPEVGRGSGRASPITSAHAGAGGVQPVDRGLAGLEVVQVDPAALRRRRRR